MSESVIRNLTTGETISHEDYVVAKTGEYPQDWFTNHPNEKPALTVPTTSTPVKSLVGLLKGLTLDQYTVDLAKAILYKYFKQVEEKLDSEWRSCGVVIGHTNQKINPFSIYQVSEISKVYEGKDLGESIDIDSYIGALLMIYRLNQLPSSVNTTEIVTRFSQRYQSLFNTRPPFAFNAASQTLSAWDSDMNFRKIVAAVDLFFEKFPLNPLSKMKFGTVSSKWRDCVALKSLFEITPALGFAKIQDLTPWLWEPSIKIDAWRILCKKLTLQSESNGYILYMSDIGLVTRSIYSASLNPAIHVFCQTIYCAMGNPRGMNARMLFPNQVRSVIRNGLMVAFALDKSHERGITIVPESEASIYKDFLKGLEASRSDLEVPNEEDSQDDQDEEGTPKIPATRNPMAWFAFFEATENKPVRLYSKFLEGVRLNCKSSRPGSVGKYLYCNRAGGIPFLIPRH